MVDFHQLTDRTQSIMVTQPVDCGQLIGAQLLDNVNNNNNDNVNDQYKLT